MHSLLVNWRILSVLPYRLFNYRFELPDLYVNEKALTLVILGMGAVAGAGERKAESTYF